MLRTLLLMVITAVTSADGQSPVSPLQAGTRVRIMKFSDRYEPRRTGVVISLAGDTAIVRLQTEPPITQTFAFTRLERYAGKRTRALEGTLIGAVVGAGIGYALATGISTTSPCDMLCLDRQPTRLRVTPIGMVVGMLIGHARGKRHEIERWKPVVPRQHSADVNGGFR
jgi:hypothetical protein